MGIGDNPVQAKLVLDLYAKHNHELIGEIHYETVPDKIWSITELTDVWGLAPYGETFEPPSHSQYV
ncbi:hypothetical protein FET70_03156 (plasmid) [Lactiplantibacillus plantarum]|nr:hypothetical protein FET70_03156 [Lactiplantibacillus plantarum]